MHDVVISKKWILAMLLLFAVIVGVVLGIPLVRRFIPGLAATTPSLRVATTATPDGDQLAQAAAVAGIQAFYSVDYRTGQQAWLDRLCAASTQIGCAIDQNALAPSLWPDFLKNQIVTTVQASIQSKVFDQTLSGRVNARAQIWQAQIQLSAPWPQQTQPLTQFSALVLVIQDQSGWKFERFLTEEETQVYQKGSQP